MSANELVRTSYVFQQNFDKGDRVQSSNATMHELISHLPFNNFAFFTSSDVLTGLRRTSYGNDAGDEKFKIYSVEGRLFIGM